MKLSKNKILEIAKDEAIRRGFDLNKLNYVEEMNTEKWNKKWKITLKANPHLSDPTINRDFTAVYFEPGSEMQLGGDLWVLVDNTSGEIIFVLTGK